MRLAVFLAFVSYALIATADEGPTSGQSHWAWKSVAAVTVPDVHNAGWSKSPIDRFILSKCEAVGIHPALTASREQLIRRVSLDLIGLPASPNEIDVFVSDSSPDAWERLVDRLMASPRYGERWGRHWLDLARYADSNGYEYDEIRPDAWRYRDYVIESFNADKPYSRFVLEQLAGDEVDPDDPSALIATGFNLLGPDMTDSSDQVQRRQNTLNDMTDTAALVFLGLTVGCARCHDHKFEPFPQIDYYRLQAFFTPAKFRHNVNVTPFEQREALLAAVKNYEAERRPVQGELDDLERPLKSKLRAVKLAQQSEEVRAAHETPEEKRTPAERERVAETIRFVNVSQTEVLKEMTSDERTQHKDVSNRLKAIDATKPKNALAMGLEDSDKPEKTFLLEMGDPSNKAEEVQPGFLVALTNESPRIVPPRASSTGRRTALAQWLTDDRHPLTARVLVNRLWHHHFGRAIVPTPSDFGVHGEAPSHPELLDWLAGEFTRGGWSIKQMHRKMLASTTYQQSTAASSATRQVDPDNRLYSRMNRQRLEGEIVRDSLLAVSGVLFSKQGGPGVSIPASSSSKPAQSTIAGGEKAEQCRRSVYLFARRNLRNPFLEVFDLPDSNLSCSMRESSTTAPQALALFNDGDVVEAAESLAAELHYEPDLVTAAYRRVLGRIPTATESNLSQDFLRDSPLSEFCRALFNVNEFVYVD